MSDNIIRFPSSSKKRMRLNEKNGKLECEVSCRWLQFPKASDKFSEIEYICLDVMTLGASDKGRKLCELILDKQQLLKMLKELPVNDKTQT